MSTIRTRRRFLATVAGTVLAVRPRLEAAAVTRALTFRHLHTGERLHVEYARGTAYSPEALAAIDRLLRDFRTGDVHPIDPRLLDLLHDLGGALASSAGFDVISGYRSPETNAALRRRSEGVAARSLHMVGQAIDIRVPGIGLPMLHAAALDLAAGGVGYYPASNFVHVDVGRLRRW